MASNLSTIGFVFDNQDSFQDAMMQCASAASARLPCDNGEYGIWRSRTGAQVWFHFGQSESGEVEIFGLSPFFEGKSSVRLQVSNVVQRRGDNAFEGAFHGWVNPDAQGKGSYPLVFDAVDFASRSGGEFPTLHNVRIAAFARELTAYGDDAAFVASQQDGDGLKFAPQAFIPTGLFAASQAEGAAGNGASIADNSAKPTATALLTGKVLEHSKLRNEATSRDFHWLVVETLDNVVIDVVADPGVVKGEIADGSTIETSVLLFGRFLD